MNAALSDKCCARVDAAADGDSSRSSMAFVPGGTFRMGSDKHYPEEAPVHRVTVDRLLDGPHTGRRTGSFREFVEADRSVTFAEIPPDPKDYPGALPPRMLYPGSTTSS